MTQEFTGTMRELAEKNCVQFSKRQKAYLMLKRSMDIGASLAGIIILLPVFILVALAIKIEDPAGSVLYKQKRIGRNGVLFTLYKFRSMKTDAPEKSTHEFVDAQNYITKVGRIIRHTSIDELPQLLNVLKGNMSLIGPRPLLPQEREVHILRFFYGLYQVRPGITGLAQTHGRDEMDDYEKVRWDRKYVQNISFGMDLKLLWRTIIKVIVREGVVDQAEEGKNEESNPASSQYTSEELEYQYASNHIKR